MWWLLLVLLAGLQVTLIALKANGLVDRTVYELPDETGRDLSGEQPFALNPDATPMFRQVVGLPHSGKHQEGRVDLYHPDTHELVQQIFGTKSGERFGHTVSMSRDGSCLVIGALNRTHVYRRVEADTTYERYDTHKVSTHSVQAVEDGFYAVTSKQVRRYTEGAKHDTLLALGEGHVYSNGNKTVVGFPKHSDYRGAAVVLDAYGTVQRLRCPAAEGAAFGRSVAISPAGQWVAVGAPHCEQVFVYRWSGEAFDLVQQLKSTHCDSFGIALALTDDSLTVYGRTEATSYTHRGQILLSGNGQIETWDLNVAERAVDMFNKV